MREIGPIPGRDGQKIAYGESALVRPLKPTSDVVEQEPRTEWGCFWFVLGCWGIVSLVVGVVVLWIVGLWWMSSKSGLGANEGALLWFALTTFVVLSGVFAGVYFENHGS